MVKVRFFTIIHVSEIPGKLVTHTTSAASIEGRPPLRCAPRAWVKGRLDEALLSRAKREAGAELRPLKQPTASRGRAANFWYEAVWSQARRDRLRRWLAVQGHPVEKMRRMRLGPLEVESLPEGRYRRLSEQEAGELETYLMRMDSRKEGRGMERSAIPAAQSTKARFRPARAGRKIKRF